MNKYVEYIREKLDYRDLLEQLAEESSELTHATLKLIRALELSKNTTPITFDEAKESFKEELNDINLVLYVLEFSDSDEALENQKLKRWAERLGYKDE